MNLEEKYQKRKESNLEILEILREEIERFPQLRFCQLLSGIGIIEDGVDKFYEESVDTLEKIKNNNKE